ncbi:GNAT family N-acetyltransferase [bacterium]|nr:GNAT family N-acetyltransferase [bacterium]
MPAKKHLRIFAVDGQPPLLRSAEIGDLENLREWKNANCRFFFHKDPINPEQQASWFQAFLDRTHDHMFIVECEGRAAGCMGIRRLEDAWEVYNVILGEAEFGRKGLMGRALKMMCRFAIEDWEWPVTLRVLKENPAVGWYLKNGFEKISEEEDHFYLDLNRLEFESPEMRVETEGEVR